MSRTEPKTRPRTGASGPDPAPSVRAASRRPSVSARGARLLGVLIGIAAAAGCRQDMYNQPKATPLVESDFFGDGRSARGPVPGTVARGQLAEDRAYAEGIGPDGKFVGHIPVPVDRALLMRGRERFDIFCSPCHDRTGSGQGMIVQRGYKQPPSLHEDRLRNQPIGYFFDVMTNGFGEMPAYASQIPRADRWAIASYIRALQFSQHAPLASLSAEDVARATAPMPPSTHRATEEAGKEGE